MWRWQTQNPRGYQDDCERAGSAATNGSLPVSKLANGAGVTNGVANGSSNGVSNEENNIIEAKGSEDSVPELGSKTSDSEQDNDPDNSSLERSSKTRASSLVHAKID